MEIEIHLTGPAGCGKSTLARDLKRFLASRDLGGGSKATCFAYYHDEQPDADGETEFMIRFPS